jgi:hypothetical protein
VSPPRLFDVSDDVLQRWYERGVTRFEPHVMAAYRVSDEEAARLREQWRHVVIDDDWGYAIDDVPQGIVAADG